MRFLIRIICHTLLAIDEQMVVTGGLKRVEEEAAEVATKTSHSCDGIAL